MLQDFRSCDLAIQPLLIALAEGGLESDWSCAGDPGHMCIRPYVQIRTFPGSESGHPYATAKLQDQRHKIECVMRDLGIGEYWLQLTYTYGAFNTHGGEAVWILQVPGRFDYIAHPVPYSVRYQDEQDGQERIGMGALPIAELLSEAAGQRQEQGA